MIKSITLTNGSVMSLNKERMICPCCSNGSMKVVSINEEEITLECDDCRSTLKIPLVSLTNEREEEYYLPKEDDDTDFGIAEEPYMK